MKNDRTVRQRNVRTQLSEKIKAALASKVSSSAGLAASQIHQLSKDPTREQIKRQNKKRVFSQTHRKYRNKRNYVCSTGGTPIRKPIVTPKVTQVSMEDWPESDQIDVSIIVPMYKSKSAIKEQIENWDSKDDGLNKEIIYVDDACPEYSRYQVKTSWEKRKNKGIAGRVLVHSENGGFSQACNAGAKYARGKYLIFLNADCIVTRNWVKPMVDLIESDPNIGIVGNLHLKDGHIDSAGSEWSWKTKSFQHIGRNTYHNNNLTSAIRANNIPKDLLVPAERHMVTGACFLIRKALFADLEGFDVQYRIGYWEDSDLNMRVRDAGYKIMYTPDSIIEHRLGHSKAGGHPYLPANRKLFHDRWIETGRLEPLLNPSKKKVSLKENVDGKVVGCVIACNEEEFLEVSVDSAAPLVDEWIFVVGGNNYAYQAGMCDKLGYPQDNTLEIAHKLANKYNGRVIKPPQGRAWKDKNEMRSAYARHLVEGNWMFLLDGDEVYKPEQLWRVTELMKKHEVLVLQFWLFWNNMNTLGTGSWGNYPQERIVRWRKGHHYRGADHLHVSDRHKRLVKSNYPCWQRKEKLFYHYSWVRPIHKIRQKLAYYKYQSKIDNQKYVDDVFLRWRTDPESVRGRTHPKDGGDFAAFHGIHPKGVQQLIKEGKLNF
jgi:GT2 family glycosyltransferase